MHAAVLSAVLGMLQVTSVPQFPQYQHATDQAWEKLEAETPPSAWTRDFTIEVSEIDGLPIPSLGQTPKDCLDNREREDGCWEERPRCRTRTSCEYIRLYPYLGRARRVTIQATSTSAMARGKPVAEAVLDNPAGVEKLKWLYFDDVPANNLLADTKNPDWIAPASARDIRDYTPPRAADLGISGATVVECVVQASGALDACDPLAVRPQNMSFELAAARLAKAKYRVKADAGAARPAAGTKVRLRIDFPATLEFHHIVVVH